jgi:8-oxo-dGTP diphosphatase
MSEECYYRISIKCTSFDEDGKFLLVREDNGKWEFPGGGLEHGEDYETALRREVHEEMGLELTYISKSPIYFTTSRRRETGKYMANVIYEAVFKDLNFTPSEECQETGFFSIEEAKELDVFDNVKSFIAVYDPSIRAAQ